MIAIDHFRVASNLCIYSHANYTHFDKKGFPLSLIATIFSALRASVWVKLRGGGALPWIPYCRTEALSDVVRVPAQKLSSIV